MKKLLFLFFSLVFELTLFGEVIYVPSNAPGFADPYPFGFGSSASFRYQQVYAASSFFSISQGGGWITNMAFRFSLPEPIYGTVSNMQINVSTTSNAVDNLSTNFSENVGPDDVRVFGPSSAAWNSAPFPNFDAKIRFDPPFFYNPALGNLLVDLRIFNSGVGFPMGPLNMHGAFTTNDTISIAVEFDVNSPTGSRNTRGLITEFEVIPLNPLRPVLDVTRSGTAVKLAWPSNFSNFLLQASTNIFITTSWSNATNQVTVSNNQFNSIIPIGAGSQFFRLKSQ